MMNFFICCFVLCTIMLTLGCADTERPNAIMASDETETPVITTEQQNQDLTEEERGKKVIEASGKVSPTQGRRSRGSVR